MKTWVNRGLGEIFRKRISELIAESAPQLCCEACGHDIDSLLLQVSDAIRDWGRDQLLALFFQGNGVRVCIVDREGVRDLICGAVESEEVVSFVDVTSIGGCAVDFSPKEDAQIEVLFTAWGCHESSAKELADRFGVDVFRGN